MGGTAGSPTLGPLHKGGVFAHIRPHFGLGYFQKVQRVQYGHGRVVKVPWLALGFTVSHVDQE
jgi:hypothetical protein